MGNTTLHDLNTGDQAAFVDTIGPVFERSPWIAALAWHDRPFSSLEHVYQSLCSALYAASEADKLALIRAHPDLAGKVAIAGELGAESTREQASAGLDRLTPEEYATFTRLNTAYRERFGFPFIICAREHGKQSILAAFESRLPNERENEVGVALGEIAKIARLRLFDTVRSG